MNTTITELEANRLYLAARIEREQAFDLTERLAAEDRANEILRRAETAGIEVPVAKLVDAAYRQVHGVPATQAQRLYTYNAAGEKVYV